MIARVKCDPFAFIVGPIAASLLLALIGCEQNPQPANSSQPAARSPLPPPPPPPPGEPASPWVELRDEDWGHTLSNFKPDGNGGVLYYIFESSKAKFRFLIETISSNFEVAIIVRPKTLLDRGITLTVNGNTAEEALTNLAEKCGLKLKSVGKNKWRLAAPNSENSPEEVINTGDPAN